MTATIRTCIAPLFVPADRPDRFAKAAATAADAVILDLEDAVAVAAKQSARQALATGFTDKPVIVRINAVGTPWHADDLAALRALPVAAIMLPKAEDVAGVADIARQFPVIALIETVRGIAAARAIAGIHGVQRLAFGSIDFALDLGCGHVRDALALPRAELLMASRLSGLAAPLDGVTASFTDPDGVAQDAAHARALGFSGKMAIHPAQLDPILAAFRPSADDIAWARRIPARGDGAVAINGVMIDAPVRARARDILLIVR